ncbi:hypothetical protein BHM03_00011757 [Ensete ventricosum]|uniref:WRKY domain-containing protein n=1 Tax=Ensete ventricosum TaxID=4639 RepID=A0A445MDA4_ENSVE|nr:hypothetical protein BHM03_00011757 [Ensete ventricosum]
MSPLDESTYKVGRLSVEERKEKIHRYMKKRNERNFSKKIKKEPKFAFKTHNEVDHLEDGYRWCKYEQKAVKDNLLPRSYYRCTSVMCGVKKRVERSSDDPAMVVTTYEGQHTHPSPIVPCSARHAPPRPLPLLSIELSMPSLLGFGMSLPVNTKEFQLPLFRSHLESPLLDFTRSIAPQNLMVTSDLIVSIEGHNQSVEIAIRDFSTDAAATAVSFIAASQPSK